MVNLLQIVASETCLVKKSLDADTYYELGCTAALWLIAGWAMCTLLEGLDIRLR